MKWWKWFKIKLSWKAKPLWKSENSDSMKRKINEELEKRIRRDLKR